MTNRTIHDEVCEEDTHYDGNFLVDVCDTCEGIYRCARLFRTGDPEFPVICEGCKF